MNFSQVGDGQLISTWFACLAWLNSPIPLEQKNELLEKALMCKILSSGQSLTVLVTELTEFDDALKQYGIALEARVRAIDPNAVSTGSAILDVAFGNRIRSLVAANFGIIEVTPDPVINP